MFLDKYKYKHKWTSTSNNHIPTKPHMCSGNNMLFYVKQMY